MVERLKEAIEKARLQRERAVTAPAAPRESLPTGRPPALDLAHIQSLSPDVGHLQRQRVISFAKSDPAHVAFDVLRTRVLTVCRENGWKRVGVSSPTKGCGKSTICVNLAYSLARHSGLRVLLLDLDLRNPHMAQVLGDADPPSMGDFLRGAIPWDAYLRRVEDNLFIGLGSRPIKDSAELLQNAQSIQRIEDILQVIAPDIVLYDLPPVLVSDDVIGFLSHLDCLMMVVAANKTRPHELEEAERLITERVNFLGVLLNMFGDASSDYAYEYA